MVLIFDVGDPSKREIIAQNISHNSRSDPTQFDPRDFGDLLTRRVMIREKPWFEPR